MSRGAFYVLFTVSGFAGLIYESIWTHYLKLFLGHAAYAQSLVLVVFMGGMAVGAAWCARFSARLAQSAARLCRWSRRSIGAGCARVPPGVRRARPTGPTTSLLPALGGECARARRRSSRCRCLLILPQSVLLGMTFPLMSAALVRARPATPPANRWRCCTSPTAWAPRPACWRAASCSSRGLGLPGTLRVAGCTQPRHRRASVWLLARPAAALQPYAAAATAAASTLLLAVAFFTGLASFIYEIVWIRMLSLVLGASTHSFELMLATFILGLALGGLAVRRRVDAAPQPVRLLALGAGRDGPRRARHAAGLRPHLRR